MLLIIPFFLYVPDFLVTRDIINRQWITHDKVQLAHTLAVIIAACSYLYYAGATCIDSEAKLYAIPLYQHVGLSIAWIAISVSFAFKYQNIFRDMFYMSIAVDIVAGAGWVLAAGFATTVNEQDFEPHTSWLWVPALYYVVFNTGAKSALKLSKD